MIDLSKISGLPMELDEKTYKLKFKAPMENMVPAVRVFEEMKPVLMDPEAKPNPDREELYYMYRDVHLPQNEELIRENKIRYDITVIPPCMIGREFVKTVGHFHSPVPGEATEIDFPEVYEVLHGQALFMIQKLDHGHSGNIRTIMAIRASRGEKVVYPPNYAHIIINIGSDVLVTANWVSSEYTADYKSISDRHGMGYYVVEGSDGKQFEIVPNKHYESLPEMRFAQGHMNTSLGFLVDEPMYETGIRHPGRLEFLNNPHKFAVELSSITS
ncbi:MAG TPA: glucose-6-phosphate isomerase family protein [Patescibacteria group bacterium]|nr:glucose-6-phosphate isomerase family protein [Patescibacteria group bacterium]